MAHMRVRSELRVAVARRVPGAPGRGRSEDDREVRPGLLSGRLRARGEDAQLRDERLVLRLEPRVLALQLLEQPAQRGHRRRLLLAMALRLREMAEERLRLAA